MKTRRLALRFLAASGLCSFVCAPWRNACPGTAVDGEEVAEKLGSSRSISPLAKVCIRG